MSTRSFSFSLFWILTLLFLIDAYVYSGLRKSLKESRQGKLLGSLYFLGVLLFYAGFYFLYTNFREKPLNVELGPNLLIGFFFAFLVFKVILLLFFLAEDLLRLSSFFKAVIKNVFDKSESKPSLPGRRDFVRQTGLALAALPFGSFLFGIVKGKYNYKLNRQTLRFSNLPKAFEGFRIVHISDIHSGSFDDREAVQRGIELINAQKADLILFTGDLVNNDSKEVIPYLEDFKKLKAQEGVYSVLGNHDYGDYKQWPDAESKSRNMDLLYAYQKEMGFNLLNNSNVGIKRNGEEIGIYGVENWGNPPFPQRGDVEEALSGRKELSFKILMSHDPTHWDQVISTHQTKFDLTLSGHTHGMQVGIEIPGFKWSPIKYIYPQWAGLYQKSDRLLYVNRGFGFLGFPGRVGIWPEITLIELQRKSEGLV